MKKILFVLLMLIAARVSGQNDSILALTTEPKPILTLFL